MIANRLCLLSVALVAIPSWTWAQDVVVQDFLTCNDIINDSVRLACYDTVSDTHKQEPVIVEESATAPTEAPTAAAIAAPTEVLTETAELAAASNEETNVVPLTDDVGLNAFERDEADAPLAIGATVTKCREDPRGKYNFYFDNGQVWKQVDDHRYRFTECDFTVTITKDGFGYRMLPDGETRKIRISRIR